MEYRNSKSLNRGGITALDIACMLMIGAVVLSVIFRFVFLKVDEAEKRDCTVSFTVTSAKSEIGYILNEGDPLMLEDGASFGVISSVAVTPAVFLATDASGETVEARYPEDTLVDISAKSSLKLIQKDSSFFTDEGIRICSGQNIILHTRLADIQVTITGVELSTVE